MKKIAVILGMHRSGTSVLSRSFVIFGADHGETSIAGKCNKRAHWEDYDVMYFNNDMLQFLNRAWYNTEAFTQEDFAKVRKAGYFDKAVQLMQKKIAATDFYVLKEPRVTMLLPFWEKVFQSLDVSVKYVFAIRNAYSVAKSLEKRNDFILEYSQFLWYAYNIFALKELEGKEVFFVDYDNFLEKTEECFQNLSIFLEADIIKREKNIFMKKVLRENHTPAKDNLVASPLYEDIYSFLVQKNTVSQVDFLPYLTPHFTYYHQHVALYPASKRLPPNYKPRKRKVRKNKSEKNIFKKIVMRITRFFS